MISNFQHLGVGVQNHENSLKWYYKYFGMNYHFFNEEASAPLMEKYTNNTIINKKAALIANTKGGAAMEVICPTLNTSQTKFNPPRLGDLGILCGIIKTKSVSQHHRYFIQNKIKVSKICLTPDGLKTFFVKDNNGLQFQVIRDSNWFSKNSHISGGIRGCIIGVSDMEKSLKLYKDILGYTQLVYDTTANYDDWDNNFEEAAEGGFRRVKLMKPGTGFDKGFERFVGTYSIVLVQDLERKPQKAQENRIWGDVGFAHIAFDVDDMESTKIDLQRFGIEFTCDSKDALAMDKNVKVHCAYIEDPDGTLIELIDVHKMPIIKKFGIYLNRKKNGITQPVPNFMLKMLKYGTIKYSNKQIDLLN